MITSEGSLGGYRSCLWNKEEASMVRLIKEEMLENNWNLEML